MSNLNMPGDVLDEVQKVECQEGVCMDSSFSPEFILVNPPLNILDMREGIFGEGNIVISNCEEAYRKWLEEL